MTAGEFTELLRQS